MLTKSLHGSALRMATRCRPVSRNAVHLGPFEPLGTLGTLAPWRRGFAEQTVYRQQLLDGNEEILTEEEKKEKDSIIKELTRKLSGPLADEDGNVPTGEDRPIAIEVDGPSHFYANSKQYTAYTKLKHRLLTRMGYKVLHVPYFEWRQLRSAKDREEYMRSKLKEEPSEWLDPEDEKYYNQGPEDPEEEEFSVKPERPKPPEAWPSTPSPPPSAVPPKAPAPPGSPPGSPPGPPGPRSQQDASQASQGASQGASGGPPGPPPPPEFQNFPQPPKDKS
eukprot:s1155_g9.t1